MRLWSGLLIYFSCLLSAANSSPVKHELVEESAVAAVSQRAVPLEQVLIPSLLVENATAATAWLDGSRAIHLSDKTIIIYTVPGTTTRLMINVWGNDLPATTMSGLILRVVNYSHNHIEAKGDGPLEPKEDPFWIDTKRGVIFGLWSIPTKHLTYSELGNVATGLFKALYLEHKYKAATFEVSRTDSGLRIGYGTIRAGRLESQTATS
ncbi:MAG: hypothetical protein Q9222_006055 [Ikaeria aurantiellina]